MKHLVSFLTFIVTLALVAGAAAVIWGANEFKRPGLLVETKTVVVEKGSGVSAIAAVLEKESVIEEPFVFKAVARLTGVHTKLKAGEYEFGAGISMAAALAKIASGDVIDRKITIREGLTSWQVVNLVNALADIGGEAVTAVPSEGTLLPETYHYQRSDTKESLLQRMQQGTTKALDELWPKRAAGLPLDTPQQAITLASIIEMETGVPEERRRVAGVFVNRLKKGMPLQTDPTVIYAITGGKIEEQGQGPLGRRLLKKDLELDSPYNTYKYPGLPPGPIANPGWASLEAALNPEAHDYLYFVADGTGGHVFATSLEEHNTNVAKWRQIRSSQN